MRQLVPGYRLVVLSGETIEHLEHPWPATAPESMGFVKTDAVARYNTTDPDFYRVGKTVFMIQARKADEV